MAVYLKPGVRLEDLREHGFAWKRDLVDKDPSYRNYFNEHPCGMNIMHKFEEYENGSLVTDEHGFPGAHAMAAVRDGRIAITFTMRPVFTDCIDDSDTTFLTELTAKLIQAGLTDYTEKDGG